MNSMQQALARRLFEIGAVQFGAFRLKAHEKDPDLPLSPIFLNLRSADNPKPGPLGEEEYRLAAVVMLHLIEEATVPLDGVAGVPNAGNPFAEALAGLLTGLPIIRLTKVTLEGGRRRIAGVACGGQMVAGRQIVLLDDLITGADSKLEAIEVVREAGGVVEDVVVLVDRQQGGEEQLRAAGCRLHAAFTLRALLDFYVAEGLVLDSKRQEVLDYLDQT